MYIYIYIYIYIYKFTAEYSKETINFLDVNRRLVEGGGGLGGSS